MHHQEVQILIIFKYKLLLLRYLFKMILLVLLQVLATIRNGCHMGTRMHTNMLSHTYI